MLQQLLLLSAAAAGAFGGETDGLGAVLDVGGDLDEGFDIDDADFDVDDGIAVPASLAELARIDLLRQKKQLESDGSDESREFDDDFEDFSSGKSDEEAPPAETLQEDFGEFHNSEDLDAKYEPYERKEPERQSESEAATDSGESTSDESSGERDSPVLHYNGMFVQTQDEDGTTLDTSSLNKEEQSTRLDIKEFIETPLKFKNQQEEKAKQKEKAKEQKRNNNDVTVYDAEYQRFVEAQEKNRDRFLGGIENAEADLQPPKSPGWMGRLKHWYNRTMDILNEKYASEHAD